MRRNSPTLPPPLRCDDTDPAMPCQSLQGEEVEGRVGEADQREGAGMEGELDYSQYYVEVQTLCLPGSLNYLGEKKSPPTENRWRQRWRRRGREWREII